MKTGSRDGVKTVHAVNRKQWRAWLEKNHGFERSVWVILYRKASQVKSVNYAEAVEEALCFGWIDSRANPRDAESSFLYFAPRKAKSAWSGLNKSRVEKLRKSGQITESGQKAIDIAKANGSWTALDEIEKGVVPPELEKALGKNKEAVKNFAAFPPSSRRLILTWIQDAKKEETRQKRIDETAKLAAQNIRAHHPKKQP